MGNKVSSCCGTELFREAGEMAWCINIQCPNYRRTCQLVDKPEPQCPEAYAKSSEQCEYMGICEGDLQRVDYCPAPRKPAEPAPINLDEVMPLLRYKREEAELRNDWRTRYKAYQQQNNKDKANIAPVIARLEKRIAELEAKLARSVELEEERKEGKANEADSNS